MWGKTLDVDLLPDQQCNKDTQWNLNVITKCAWLEHRVAYKAPSLQILLANSAYSPEGRLLLKFSLLGEFGLCALQEETTTTAEFRVRLLFLGPLSSKLNMNFKQGLGGFKRPGSNTLR